MLLGREALLYLPDASTTLSAKGEGQPGLDRTISPVSPRLTSLNVEHFWHWQTLKFQGLSTKEWKGMGRHHTKTDVVVEVVDVVVAVGAAGVPRIIIEGTTTQRAALNRSALPPEGDLLIIQQT